ncbi:MAG: extracellular solute-binding protein [Thermoplasmata archaeon]
MKKFIVLFLMSVFLVVLTINVNAITINFWTENTQPYQVSILKTLINEFEAQNPDIHVDYRLVSWGNYMQVFLTALKTNQTPVVSQLGTTKMPFFWNEGGLIDLDKYITADLKKDVIPSTWYSCQFDGKLFGIPWAVDARYTFYRKDWFEKSNLSLPTNSWTWEDMINDALKLTDAKKYVYGLGLCYDTAENTGMQAFWSLFSTVGGNVLSKDGKTVTLNSTQTLYALKLYTEPFLKYHIVPPSAPSLTGPDMVALFSKNEIGIYYSNNLSAYSQAVEANPSLADKIGVVLNPTINGNQKNFLGGSDLVMWKGHSQEEYQAAWKWIEFLMSTKIEAKYAVDLIGGLPSIESAYSDPDFLYDLPYMKPYYNIFEQSVADGVEEPNLSITPVIESAFRQMINSAALGTPLNEAIKRATEQISSALSNNS